jgi:hypothetical protein
VSDLVRQVWQRDFANASQAIPTSWLHTDADGRAWIAADRRDEPIVALYWRLACVGCAKGWL